MKLFLQLLLLSQLSHKKLVKMQLDENRIVFLDFNLSDSYLFQPFWNLKYDCITAPLEQRGGGYKVIAHYPLNLDFSRIKNKTSSMKGSLIIACPPLDF